MWPCCPELGVFLTWCWGGGVCWWFLMLCHEPVLSKLTFLISFFCFNWVLSKLTWIHVGCTTMATRTHQFDQPTNTLVRMLTNHHCALRIISMAPPSTNYIVVWRAIARRDAINCDIGGLVRSMTVVSNSCPLCLQFFVLGTCWIAFISFLSAV